MLEAVLFADEIANAYACASKRPPMPVIALDMSVILLEYEAEVILMGNWM